jgi:hypothetical protein
MAGIIEGECIILVIFMENRLRINKVSTSSNSKPKTKSLTPKTHTWTLRIA